MENKIKTYPVNHPLLKKYINFFWELNIAYIEMDHTIIPQRNINMRINLSDTSHFVFRNENPYLLENVYFSGLQNRFMNARLNLKGKVDVIGISFLPFGFYPFVNIPAEEFNNQILGTGETGFKEATIIGDRLKEVTGTKARLEILEKELVILLNRNKQTPQDFMKIFNYIKENNYNTTLTDFSKRNDLSISPTSRICK